MIKRECVLERIKEKTEFDREKLSQELLNDVKSVKLIPSSIVAYHWTKNSLNWSGDDISDFINECIAHFVHSIDVEICFDEKKIAVKRITYRDPREGEKA